MEVAGVFPWLGGGYVPRGHQRVAGGCLNIAQGRLDIVGACLEVAQRLSKIGGIVEDC